MIGADGDAVKRSIAAATAWRNAQLAAATPIDVREVKILLSDNTYATLTWDTGIVVNGNPIAPDWRVTITA